MTQWTGNTRKMLLLSLVLLFLASICAPSVTPGQAMESAGPMSISGEVLIALFRNGPLAVRSQQTYSGPVTITVSGIGQASATAYSDAFYILTNNAGVPVIPWRPNTYYNWLLWINGQHAENLIPGQQVPAPSADHTYTFTINASGGQLTFGVGDVGTQDNTGSYVINIEGVTACTVPFFSQRDPRWIDHPLRTNGACSPSCSTIGACGCTLTASAMLFAYYGADLTPATLSDCMGTAACPYDWGTSAACSSGNATWVARYEFTYARMDQELNQNGRPVVLGMHLSTDPNSTHWVLVTSGQGSTPENYLVHDPWPVEGGAGTSLAVLTRQGYVPDYISVYDGEPVCNRGDAPADLFSALTEQPAMPAQGQSAIAAPPAAAGQHPDVITGSVVVYHMEITAVIMKLSAVSTSGAVTHMQIWTDSGPAPTWQPFSALAWLPWQPGDRIHARFRDEAGNVSADYSDSLRPVYNPPPLPTLTPTPTPTATATPTPTPTATPRITFYWLPMLQVQ